MTVLAMTAALFHSTKITGPRPAVANGMTGASGGPIYTPRAHPYQTYRGQQRDAKKRRRAKQ